MDSSESYRNEFVHCPLPYTTSHPDPSGCTPPFRRRNVRATNNISWTKPIDHKRNFPSSHEGCIRLLTDGVVKIATAREE
nr:hypothetical protein [uncultured Draconibacterium sp.]